MGGGLLDDLLAGDDDAGLVVGRVEDVGERLLDGVGEDEGAADHRDAQHDGQRGEQRAGLAAQEALDRDAGHHPVTSSSVSRIVWAEDGARSLTMLPSARKRMRSAIAAACASCVTITVVWPRVSTESRSSARISPPLVESRLPVGSSANMTLGRETSARATATRCCWPPESSDGLCDRRSPRPTLATTSSSQAGSGLAPARRVGSTMFSAAVSIGSRLKNWKMKPMWSRRSLVSSSSPRPLMSTPETVTSPEVGLSRPARMCMSVDLPEPEGPMTAVRRPAAMSTETLRSASTAVSPSP